jgi:hypothetical protein
MDGKIEQRVCIKFCVKLGKSAIKTLEMLCEALENILQAGQRFLNGIRVSGSVECHLKMTNFQGDQAPEKQQKVLKEFDISTTMTVAEQCMSAQTLLLPVTEFAWRS